METRLTIRQFALFVVLAWLCQGCLVDVKTGYELIEDGSCEDIFGLPGKYFFAADGEVHFVQITKTGKGKYLLNMPEDGEVATLKTHKLDDTTFLVQTTNKSGEYVTVPVKLQGGDIYTLDDKGKDDESPLQKELATLKTKREGMDKYNPFFVKGQLDKLKSILRKYRSTLKEEKFYLTEAEAKLKAQQQLAEITSQKQTARATPSPGSTSKGVTELADELVFIIGSGTSPHAFFSNQRVSSVYYRKDTAKGLNIVVVYDAKTKCWFNSTNIQGVRISANQGKATVVLNCAAISLLKYGTTARYTEVKLVDFFDFAKAKRVKDLLLQIKNKTS